MPDIVPKVRVFLVDDEKQFVLTQTQWLEKQGYAVTSASSVDEAKECLKENAQKFGLALLAMAQELFPIGRGDRVVPLGEGCVSRDPQFA